MRTATFHIASVLSVVTGTLLTHVGQDHPVDGLYEVLSFMTGEDLYTHALPRAANQCKPDIIRQHPWLGSADVKERVAHLRAMLGTPSGKANPRELILGWLSEFTMHYPEQIDLHPLPLDDRAPQDPIAEAEAMFGKDRVIVVPPPSETSA